MLSLGWLLDGYVIYSNYTIEYAFDATFQISKIKRPAPIQQVENAENFSAFDESNLFSVNILKIQVWFSWSTVGSAEMLPSASKRCLTDRIKAAAKAVATTTCIMGLICFKKWQGFLVILITWSLWITMTSINVIFLIWGFVQGNLGYIILCCRNKTFHF